MNIIERIHNKVKRLPEDLTYQVIPGQARALISKPWVG